jgi:hypothetical protein
MSAPLKVIEGFESGTSARVAPDTTRPTIEYVSFQRSSVGGVAVDVVVVDEQAVRAIPRMRSARFMRVRRLALRVRFHLTAPRC